MTRQEILDFFSARNSHWQSRNPRELAMGHAENGTVVSPMFGALRGRQAIGDAYETLFMIFPDWELTAEEPLIDGARVAQPFGVSATHVGEFMGIAGTNRRFSIQGVRLFEMGDGLVQHERRMYDFTGLLIQVGVLRSKPAK
jgi:predicted ester cyclase